MPKTAILTLKVFIHTNLQIKSQASLFYEYSISNTIQPKQVRFFLYILCVSKYQLTPNWYRLPVQSVTIIHLNEQVINE